MQIYNWPVFGCTTTKELEFKLLWNSAHCRLQFLGSRSWLQSAPDPARQRLQPDLNPDPPGSGRKPDGNPQRKRVQTPQ